MAEPSEQPESNNMLPTRWACNICLEEARNAVITNCGHLFCWSCLHPWMERNNPCPLCRAPITLGGIVPVYGSAVAGASEEAAGLPPRPLAGVTRPPPPQRPPPPRMFPLVPIPEVDTALVAPRLDREMPRGVEVEQLIARDGRREQIAREEEQILENLNAFQGQNDHFSRMQQRLSELLAMNTDAALSGAPETPCASSQ